MLSGKTLRLPICAISLALLAPCALADGTYQFTIDSQNSALNSSISVTAPTTGTLIGNYDATTNPPTGTRTKPGFFGSFGDTENVPVPVSVALAVSGDNTTNPAGTFVLRLDTEGGVAGLTGLTLDLLGADVLAIAATANVNWSTFRTRNPTCIVFGGITIPIPLGQATVTTLTAVQGEDEAVGTLIPAGADSFTIAIPVTMEVTLAAAFLEQEIPPTPQSIPVIFVATVTLDAEGNASISAAIEGFEVSQEQEGPIGEPFNLPFTEPICQGNLIFTLQLQSLGTSTSLDATLIASGTKVPPAPTCPCDWDTSGAIGVPDIFAFLSSWFAMDAAADFDGSGSVAVPDIFAFLSCWLARPGNCV